MARLQILELPVEHHGDGMVTPFLLVIDQVDDDTAAEIARWPDNISSRTGARHVLCFGETVEIPANEVGGSAEPLPRVGEFTASEDPDRAGTTQIVYAYERTRLDLCSALLVSGDIPWRKLVELVAERQRELSDLYRKLDEQPEAQLRAEALHAEARADLTRSENARDELRKQRDEARQWARHGYEIGQRHCSWTDYGVAPDWLTEGWPRSFGSCEHLQQAAAFDEALTRVRNLPTEPEVMNARQEHPDVWKHGYHCGVLAAKSATRPRNEKTSKP